MFLGIDRRKGGRCVFIYSKGFEITTFSGKCERIHCLRGNHPNQLSWLCSWLVCVTAGGGVRRMGVALSSAGALLLGKREERKLRIKCTGFIVGHNSKIR